MVRRLFSSRQIVKDGERGLHRRAFLSDRISFVPLLKLWRSRIQVEFPACSRIGCIRGSLLANSRDDLRLLRLHARSLLGGGRLARKPRRPPHRPGVPFRSPLPLPLPFGVLRVTFSPRSSATLAFFLPASSFSAFRPGDAAFLRETFLCFPVHVLHPRLCTHKNAGDARGEGKTRRRAAPASRRICVTS